MVSSSVLKVRSIHFYFYLYFFFVATFKYDAELSKVFFKRLLCYTKGGGRIRSSASTGRFKFEQFGYLDNYITDSI